MNSQDLAKIAIEVLDGGWNSEEEVAYALKLSEKELSEVRRLMHLPYQELKRLS